MFKHSRGIVFGNLFLLPNDGIINKFLLNIMFGNIQHTCAMTHRVDDLLFLVYIVNNGTSWRR